ncbi:hypothetical protein [Pontibacter kalidii]|uniref:hypothetical protein n=1 Tax=Pontibacter kalidii TaxID=2592049 RepID=UPI00225B6266|nr:hypothetical protein [Pontibacter kalidii]
MNASLNYFRISVLTVVSLIYLMNSFKIGFWITGDMHSGGPFVGPLLFPLLLAILTFLLFINNSKVRRVTGLLAVAYLALGLAMLLFI